MKTKLILATGVVAVLAVGGYFAVAHTMSATAAGEEQAAPAAAPPPTEVVVITVKDEPLVLRTQLPARVSPFRVAEIRPQVSGIVTKRFFTEGSDVKKGEQLYQIDEAPYRAAYNSAKADLQKAHANLKSVEARAARYTELVKINAVSQQDYDDATAQLAQAEADVAVAKAALDTAKINVDYTKVFSPIAGRIGKSLITEGALVTANQESALATVQQLDPVYVDITQSSTELMRLRQTVAARAAVGKDAALPAPKVTLAFEGDIKPYDAEGELQFSDVTVDPTTGAVQIRALFPNPSAVLLPGLFVRAQISLDQGDNVLMLPQQTVLRNPDSSTYVWTVDAQNTVHKTPVTVDKAVGDQWQVASGVEEGAIVILEGVQKIREGAVVKPVFKDAATETPATTPADTQQQP